MCQKLILIVMCFLASVAYAITPEDREQIKEAQKRFQDYLIEHKEEIATNIQKAYQQALDRAEKGDSEAMLALSSLGVGPSSPKEVKKAASEWLHLAADYGNVEAQIQLGNAYRNGDSLRLIPIDLEKAKKYLKLAADTGDITAVFYYKDLIECGIPGQEAEDCK